MYVGALDAAGRLVPAPGGTALPGAGAVTHPDGPYLARHLADAPEQLLPRLFETTQLTVRLHTGSRNVSFNVTLPEHQHAVRTGSGALLTAPRGDGGRFVWGGGHGEVGGGTRACAPSAKSWMSREWRVAGQARQTCPWPRPSTGRATTSGRV